MHISIAAEPLFSFLGFKVTNSLLTSWIVIFLILFSAAIFRWRKRLSLVPGKMQNLVEMLIEGVSGLIREIAGKKTERLAPILITFFIYILALNWFGLFPGVGSIGYYVAEHGHRKFIPLLRGGTADINTTLALAIFSIISVQVYGVKFLGFREFIKRYINLANPINFFVGILEIFSEISKIISFSFRLFGNIFAGEVLLTVMVFLVPIVVPVFFLGLEVFVGLIQALIFMMLSLIFIISASEGHSDKKEKENIKLEAV